MRTHVELIEYLSDQFVFRLADDLKDKHPTWNQAARYKYARQALMNFGITIGDFSYGLKLIEYVKKKGGIQVGIYNLLSSGDLYEARRQCSIRS